MTQLSKTDHQQAVPGLQAELSEPIDTMYLTFPVGTEL